MDPNGYEQLAAWRRGKAEGLTRSELNEVIAAFGVDATVLRPPLTRIASSGLAWQRCPGLTGN
jgi:hypothetical protein